LLAGGILVVAAGLLLYSSSGDTKTAAATDERHCPNCGRELPRSAAGQCPFCKLEKMQEEQKNGKKNEGRSWAATDFLLIATVLFLTFGGGYLAMRSLKSAGWLRRGSQRPAYYHRCPWCKRKIRFALYQAGKEALCPSCRHAMVLPVPE